MSWRRSRRTKGEWGDRSRVKVDLGKRRGWGWVKEDEVD